MKKFCFVLALSVAAAASFAGCRSKFDPNAVTVMGKKSDLQKPYMTEIFGHYKETTGENLNILSVKDENFESEALRRMGKADAPDILLHFHNADLDRFDVAENFLYLDDAAWKDDLTDSALKYCTTADGHLLGLPFWESSVSGCYYNKKLLSGFGLPSSQEEFDGMCRNLLSKNITPILWPANGCSWMAQFGLDPVFADEPEGPGLLSKLNAGEIDYGDIPQVLDMVTWLNGAAKNGWFGDSYLNTGWDDISPALAEGKAAMTFIWDTWFYTDFKEGTYTKDDFALMPIFMNTLPAGGTYEGGNLNMMMVNKNSEKREKALSFLEFCASPENYNVAFEGISTVSVFKGQTTNIESRMVTEEKNSIAKHERVSTASTKIAGYSAEDVLRALNEMFKGNLTPAECVKKMDADRREKAHLPAVAE